MDKDKLAKAIEYAIRSNRMEGLEPSREELAMLEKVKAGQLTFDEYRQIIDKKALAKKSIIDATDDEWAQIMKNIKHDNA